MLTSLPISITTATTAIALITIRWDSIWSHSSLDFCLQQVLTRSLYIISSRSILSHHDSSMCAVDLQLFLPHMCPWNVSRAMMVMWYQPLKMMPYTNKHSCSWCLSKRSSYGDKERSSGKSQKGCWQQASVMLMITISPMHTTQPIGKILLLGIQAGLQLGIGSAMAVVTLAGMSGLLVRDCMYRHTDIQTNLLLLCHFLSSHSHSAPLPRQAILHLPRSFLVW